jgi:predicted exporter
LREEGQGPVAAAVEGAWAAARVVAPGVDLRWTAISRFAAESRRRIEHEMSVLNLISLAAVLAVAAVSVRHVFKALHLVPVIFCAILGAWVVTTMVFDRVHVLVFVVGSLLGGVAVDYGFYLYLQPPLRPGAVPGKSGPVVEAAAGERADHGDRVFAAVVFRTAIDPAARRFRQRRTAVRPGGRAALVRAGRRALP